MRQSPKLFLFEFMPFRLKLDPRLPAYDSIAEATLPEDEGEVDDAVEQTTWSAVPARGRPARDVAFVDGVERREKRLSAEGEGRAVPGMLVSYAAGTSWPGRARGVCDAGVERRLLLGCGLRAPVLRLQSHFCSLEYRPVSSPETDFDGLGRELNHLRADLEGRLVQSLRSAGADMVVVDGRLPPEAEAPAMGLIKTPHVLPSVVARHFELLAGLTQGQRSPIFVRRRSDRAYYAWFLCLRSPGPSDIALSGLALLEMSAATGQSEAERLADASAATLPTFASQPFEDDRAPQNLLPVGLLERSLRHLLGDPELVHRLTVEAFAREEIWC
jgi:hypothetical protein